MSSAENDDVELDFRPSATGVMEYIWHGPIYVGLITWHPHGVGQFLPDPTHRPPAVPLTAGVLEAIARRLREKTG